MTISIAQVRRMLSPKKAPIDVALEILSLLIGLFSTFTIVRIGDHVLSIYFSILFIGLAMWKKQQFTFSKINLPFLLFIGSVLITSVFQVGAIIPITIMYLYADLTMSCQDELIRKMIAGVRISCVVQLVWCVLQFFYFQVNFDLNSFVFTDTLHLVNRASFGTSLTGLAWHPCNLIPTLLLSVLFFPKWYTWLICFFIAVNANSSTTMLALILALAMMAPGYLKSHVKNHLNISVKKIIIVLLALSVLGVVLVKLFPYISGEIARLTNRISDGSDESSYLHKRYYTSIPYVWKNSSSYKILFGYGYHRSGTPFSALFGQYKRSILWSVESDPMDILYGNGIIGFILFYWWIVGMIFKSMKREYLSFIFFAVMAVCGIAYNCQFEWVLLIELLFAVGLEKKMKIFQNSSDWRWTT